MSCWGCSRSCWLAPCCPTIWWTPRPPMASWHQNGALPLLAFTTYAWVRSLISVPQSSTDPRTLSPSAQ